MKKGLLMFPLKMGHQTCLVYYTYSQSLIQWKTCKKCRMLEWVDDTDVVQAAAYLYKKDFKTVLAIFL